MRRSKSLSPSVEGLESLTFLSAVGGGGPTLAALFQQRQEANNAPKPSGPIDLSGSLRGRYALAIAADGNSGAMEFQGTGAVRGLGPVRLSGTYMASTASAPETMDLTLEGRRGGVTLRIGRVAGDVDPSPSTARLRYQVVAGTGSYAASNGAGILDLTVRPQVRSLGAAGQIGLALHPITS